MKRVLLAYARFNKTTGYCQGFNIIAALILRVVNFDEEVALKVWMCCICPFSSESFIFRVVLIAQISMIVLVSLDFSKNAYIYKHKVNKVPASVCAHVDILVNYCYFTNNTSGGIEPPTSVLIGYCLVLMLVLIIVCTYM